MKASFEVTELNSRRTKVLRNGLTFMAKLWLDGLKDVTLSVLALFAVAIDFIRASDEEPRQFQRVMAFGRRFDRWLDLYEPYDANKLLNPQERDPR